MLTAFEMKERSRDALKAHTQEMLEYAYRSIVRASNQGRTSCVVELQISAHDLKYGYDLCDIVEVARELTQLGYDVTVHSDIKLEVKWGAL